YAGPRCVPAFPTRRSSDLVCDDAQKRGYKHFFYGGAEGVADLLAEKLKARFPQLQVAGVYCPPFRKLTVEEDRDLVAQINASGADRKSTRLNSSHVKISYA